MPNAVEFDRSRITDPALQPIAEKVTAGERLTAADGVTLFRKGDAMEDTLSSYLEFRKKYLKPIERRGNRFNDRLAVIITDLVGTMWCAYAFAGLALISLPAAIKGGTATLIAWIAQTFLQLVLLSIIMVGQKVGSEKSDRQLDQTYRDAETLLTISDEIRSLLKQNTELTEQIHELVGDEKKK